MKKKDLARHLDAVGANVTRVRVVPLGKEVLTDAEVDALRVGIAVGVAYAATILDGEMPVEAPEGAVLTLVSAGIDVLTGGGDDE